MTLLLGFYFVYLKVHFLLHRYHKVRQYNDQLANLERAFLDASTLFTNGYMLAIFYKN